MPTTIIHHILSDVEFRKRLFNVLSLRTIVAFHKIASFGYSVKRSMRLQVQQFLFAARHITCSTYLDRGVDNNAGHLAYHRKYQGMLP